MSYTPGTVTSIAQLNVELSKISTAIQERLSRTSTAANYMDTNLDMNSRRILNLPAPASPTDPVRLKDLPGLVLRDEYTYEVPAFAGSSITLPFSAVSVLVFLNGFLFHPHYNLSSDGTVITLSYPVTESDSVVVVPIKKDISGGTLGGECSYTTLQDAKLSYDLRDNSLISTAGYWGINDQGGAMYLVRGIGWPEVADGYKNHSTEEGKFLELVQLSEGLYAAQYGVAESQLDNSPALQFVLNDAAPKEYGGKIKKVFLPEGYIKVGSTIKGNQVHMVGQGWSSTWIQYNTDITVFEIKGSITIKDLSVQNLAGKGNEQGICFGSERNNNPDNTMSYCVFESVFCWYADISFWIRASTHCNWLNCSSYSLVGLRFARNADPYDAETPNIGGWNAISPTLGWFHNMNTITNFIGNDVECGIWGSLMGAVIHATCQGQLQDKALNRILPTWAEPTGMYLEGGSSVAPAWGNTITYYYTENTKVPLRLTYVNNVVIQNMFVQGWTYDDRYPAVIVADNSDVTIKKMTGQGYFDKKCILTGNSKVVGPIGGAVLGEYGDEFLFTADATSKWMPTGEGEQYIYRKQYSFVATGTPGTTATAVLSDSEVNFAERRSLYRVTVSGLYDGAVVYVKTWDMFYWNTEVKPAISLLGYGDNGVSLNVPDTVDLGWALGGVPFVEVSTTSPNSFEILVEKITQRRAPVTVVS